MQKKIENNPDKLLGWQEPLNLMQAISSSRILEAWARRMLSLGEAGIAGLMDLFQVAIKRISA